MMLSRSQSV